MPSTSTCSGWVPSIIGSQATLPMKSGMWFSEKLLVLLNSEPPAWILVTVTPAAAAGIGREGGLRIFHRHRHPELLVPVLGDAQLRLAGPVEADGILRVDGGRRHFVARRDAVAVERRQRPVLAGQQLQAQRIPVDRSYRCCGCADCRSCSRWSWRSARRPESPFRNRQPDACRNRHRPGPAGSDGSGGRSRAVPTCARSAALEKGTPLKLEPMSAVSLRER